MKKKADNPPRIAHEIRPIPKARLAKRAPISVGAGPVNTFGSGAPKI